MAKKTTWIALALLCAAILFSTASGAHPEDHIPVATVFGHVIYADELVHESAIAKMKAKLDPDEYDIWYARARETAFRSRVWSAIFANYPGVKSIAATSLETNEFLVYARRLRQERRARREHERNTLTADLKDPGLSDAKRTEIEHYLEGAKAWLDRDDRIEAERTDPKREHIRLGLDERAAENAVVQWKIKQAIYQEFGGRIAFGRDGWEPLDAYYSLVQREEKDKSILFSDPVLREAFLNSFTHNFHFGDEKQARFYFERPYWERTTEEMRNAGFHDVTELTPGEEMLQ